MIPKGSTVQVVKEHLRETGSFGEVKHFYSETGWYSVELNRPIPPFRGLYDASEIVEIKP